MFYLPNIIFVILLVFSISFFIKNISKIIRNIKLGRSINRSDNPVKRWKILFKVALGQSKMVRRPVAGILHIFVYLGFIIVNIEMLEILIDGVFGTHRVFAFMGSFYNFLIACFEILALLVIISTISFWVRRVLMKIPRFHSKEMTRWPKQDALNILYFEMILMSLFLLMNAADQQLQYHGVQHYVEAGRFPVSGLFSHLLTDDTILLVVIERSAWWLHIIGVFVFLNYLYYSKHFHILSAFPNTWYADLNLQGQVDNLDSITEEVRLMMNPSIDPFSVSTTSAEVPNKFGASDVLDLNRIQLLNAYTCTECGRCTASCPANQTGKLLSPRAIMMKTRDRLEEVGKNVDKNKSFVPDGKQLLGDYITPEELWACTTCNACVQECPLLISPLSIIIDLRRYLVMEQSSAPPKLNNMMANIENNAAPWQYSQMDRLNWAEE